MNIYEVENYREFMVFLMRSGSGRTWGAVKHIASVLKCHSTYVSQIIKGKADPSTEQVLALCKHFQLDLEATDHFLDLVNRDKAGNQETKDYFRSRIEKRVNERLNIKKRLNINEDLTHEQEAKYYRGWLPQAIHICCQLPGKHTVKSIASRLTVSEATVAKTLVDIESVGLIAESQGGYRSIKEMVHLGSDSANINRFHINWRMKTVSDLMNSTSLPGTHYSSVFCISKETARDLRELILSHIEETRTLIIPSASEHIYVYSLDFYSLSDH